MSEPNSNKTTNLDNINVENLIQDLNQIVEQLENEATPIEEAFNLFEKGTKISKQLNQKLNSYEKKLKILSKDELVETNSENYI